MLALAYEAYELDTIESSTQDVTMQVQIPTGEDAGVWHRKLAAGDVTACGEPINYHSIIAMRNEAHIGKLCVDCHTAYELALSERANDKEKGI